MRIRSLPRLRPPISLALGLVTLVAAVVTSLATVPRVTQRFIPPRVYSLASLQSVLARHPAVWLGRSVFVHAEAVPCQDWSGSVDSCFTWQPALIDADNPMVPALPIVTAPALLRPTWLRNLPIIDDLLPRPRPIGWGVPANFTVRLQARACLMGSPSMCYEALIQDVAL